MGRDSNFICHTCKKVFDLGYGPYSYWLDFVKNLEDFEEKANERIDEFKQRNEKYGYEGNFDPRIFHGNLRIIKCLKDHEGHDFDFFSYDWHFEKNGHLYMEMPYGEPLLSVKDFCQYEQIPSDLLDH